MQVFVGSIPKNPMVINVFDDAFSPVELDATQVTLLMQSPTGSAIPMDDKGVLTTDGNQLKFKLTESVFTHAGDYTLQIKISDGESVDYTTQATIEVFPSLEQN